MIKFNPFNIIKKHPQFTPKSLTTPETLQPVSFRLQNNLKLLNPTPVKLKNGTATVLVGNSMDSYSQFSTYVNSKTKNEMGRHSFDVEKNVLDGIEMDTWNKYQGKGIGEIMRLVSVIETAENHLKGLSAVSLSRAVPFHFKYLFRPDILTQITNNEHSTADFKEKAKIMLNFQRNSGLTPEFVKDFDKFLTNYIKENLNRWDRAGFSPANGITVPMSLNLETIRQNSGFFNELFQKHGIDYKI